MASEMSSFGCEMYHVSPRFLGTTCNCHHLRTFVLIHQIQLKTQENSAHNYHIIITYYMSEVAVWVIAIESWMVLAHATWPGLYPGEGVLPR